MPAPDWEDLTEFLDTDEHAIPAMIHLSGGEDRPVSVIYENPYLNAELGEYDMDNVSPRAGGRMADFVSVKRGDTITIDGQTLDILTEPQGDGTGWGQLELGRPVD